MNKNKKRENFIIVFIVLVVLLIFSITAGTAFGSSYIKTGDVYKFIINKISGKEIFSPSWKISAEAIILEVRVPRIILSVISGGGLALCGVLMQCITKIR